MAKELGDLDELDPKAKPTTLSLPHETRVAINRLRRVLRLDKAAHVVRRAIQSLETDGHTRSDFNNSLATDLGLSNIVTSPDKQDYSELLKTSEMVFAIIPDFRDFISLHRHFQGLCDRIKNKKPTAIIIPECFVPKERRLSNELEAFNLIGQFENELIAVLKGTDKTLTIYRSDQEIPAFLLGSEDICWWGSVPVGGLDNYPMGLVFTKSIDGFGMHSQLLSKFMETLKSLDMPDCIQRSNLLLHYYEWKQLEAYINDNPDVENAIVQYILQSADGSDASS